MDGPWASPDARRDRGRGHHRRPDFGPLGADLGPRGMGAALHGLRRPGGRGGARRGEIRPLILAVLATKPMHGYEVIQALELQSSGRWRPSAGSVYPTLQQLADEGLVTSEELEGRRTYTLTEAGRAAAAAAPSPRPWDEPAGDQPDLRRVALQLVGAVMQIQQVGSTHARTETLRILGETRRQLYRLLADDEVEPGADGDIAVDPTTDDPSA